MDFQPNRHPFPAVSVSVEPGAGRGQSRLERLFSRRAHKAGTYRRIRVAARPAHATVDHRAG